MTFTTALAVPPPSPAGRDAVIVVRARARSESAGDLHAVAHVHDAVGDAYPVPLALKSAEDDEVGADLASDSQHFAALVGGGPKAPHLVAHLDALGLDAADVLMIGDQLETDIAGAKAVGIDAGRS